MVEKGNVVSVHYTGKLESGEVFDSSREREPLKFQVGSGQIIPGFEDALIGKKVGESIEVNLTSDEAYGEVREDLVVSVEKDKMPGEVKVGQSLQANTENGQSANVVVKEVKDNEVIIDGNHPLAGKNLSFDIEIMDIEKLDNQEK